MTTRPLGSVPFSFAEEDKDEEEKRLEALLFGTKFAAHETIDPNAFKETGDMGGYTDKVHDELNSVMDSDVRTFFPVNMKTFAYPKTSCFFLTAEVQGLLP
ncbi:MAG TPA: hypothetical protein VGO47_04245 [Chlamydiales bacterium]|nr:hypothetical protein [Chlamydiales bacterium]